MARPSRGRRRVTVYVDARLWSELEAMQARVGGSTGMTTSDLARDALSYGLPRLRRVVESMTPPAELEGQGELL